MSIFREPFDPIITDQLNARQNLIGQEIYSSSDMAYLNSKSAWIQLRSSVDVEFNGRSSSNGLATDNVLLGGTLLSSNKQRSGIGTNGFGVYDTNVYNKSLNINEPNLLGLRAMPGITNLSIQNKGAYGSLRQATVTFQCWDVKQLEILEMLYMRPGYTLLLEWGWLPYIDNEGTLTDRLLQDTLFFGRKDINIQKYLNDLRKLSIQSGGNYDAVFGYVMNYSWKYRMDGGYDCSTEIISTGEVLESLKINTSGASVSSTSSGTLLSSIQYTDIKKIQKEYRRNILTGLISETYALALETQKEDTGIGSFKYTYLNKSGIIDFARLEIELETGEMFGDDDEAAAKNPGGNQTSKSILDSESNIFITLESFIRLLNDFVLLENNNISDNEGSNTKNIVSLSVYDRPTSKDPTKLLSCLYHPLQISIDPRVCILNNPLFEKLIQGIKISNEEGPKIEVIPPKLNPQFDSIIKNLEDIRNRNGNEQELLNELSKIKNKEELAGIADSYYVKSGKTFYSLLTLPMRNDDNNLTLDIIGNKFANIGIIENNIKSPGDAYLIRNYIDITPQEREKVAIESVKSKLKKQTEELNEVKSTINSKSPGYLSTLNLLPKRYHPGDNTKFANHGNIYINLKLLYNLATSTDLESQDPAEKQTISVMTYLKDILTYIQNSTGNVNNFEVIIEDNVGYIVDVNNVPNEDKVDPFTFEVGNRKSIIKDISLESQIFSDQSTIIAVSAQSDAGKLGLENSSMIAYNTGIKDRMISKRDNPVASNTPKEKQVEGFISALSDLLELFDSMNKTLSVFDSELLVDDVEKYKKALNDIIVFFTSVYKTDNKYKSILPTKLSITTDGIGGLIIGNIFNIDKASTPRGYKGNDGVGIELQYLITNIKQEVNANGQWSTTIEGNPFIPDSSFNILTLNQDPLKLDMNIIRKYIYDKNTGQVKEEIINNNNPIGEVPPGVTGNSRAMASAMNYVLGGPKKGIGQCNRFTYNLARNYTLFKQGKDKEATRGARFSSGGHAATLATNKFYEKLGYSTTKISLNFTKKQMENYLKNYSNFNVGEVVSYRSSNDVHFHAQIYTGGLGWNSDVRSFSLKASAPRWASDDSDNYSGNFIYKSQIEDSYTLYVHKLS